MIREVNTLLHLQTEVEPYQLFLESGKLFSFQSVQWGYETTCFIVKVPKGNSSLIQLIPLRPYYIASAIFSFVPTIETLWMDRRQFCGYTILPSTLVEYDANFYTYSIIEDCMSGQFTLPEKYDETTIWIASKSNHAKSYLYLEVSDLSSSAVLYEYSVITGQSVTYDLKANSKEMFYFENSRALTIRRCRKDGMITGKYNVTRILEW